MPIEPGSASSGRWKTQPVALDFPSPTWRMSENVPCLFDLQAVSNYKVG